MAFGYFTFQGHLDSLNGAPASGVVRIEGLPNVLIDTAGDKIVVGPKTVVLDQLGNFSISLPVDTSYNGGLRNGYRVTPDLKGLANIAPTEFYAPAVNATLDYSDVIHINVVSLTPTGVSQADFDAYKATAGSGGGTGQATRTGSKPVGQGEMVFNVKDYGAVGNGTTDDSQSIQNAVDACYNSGVATVGTVFFPAGTYLVSGTPLTTTSIISGADNVTFQGAGAKISTLKVAAGTTRTRLIGVTNRTGMTFRDLGFDGSSSTTCLSGVHSSSASTPSRNLRVERCFFRDFGPSQGSTTNGAVYTWVSDGITVQDSEFSGCGRPIVVDQPDGYANIIRNRIYAPLLSNVMNTGIYVRKSSTSSEGKVLIEGNYIYGADRDTSNVGSEGHGISIYRVRDAQVIGNHCYYNGRGIIASFQSFGTIIKGNTCVGNYDSGIRVEPEITGFNTSVGTDVVRGVIVEGNTCRNSAPRSDKPVGGGNYGIGLEISFAAGSIAQGNLCHDNNSSGLHVDSDRVIVAGNQCYNNGKGSLANVSVGFYFNDGASCTIYGNQAWDNQTTKTQQYGIYLNNKNHIVFGNSLAGNSLGEFGGTGGVGAIRQGFFGTTPVAKPATTADATDLASVITLANALKANLQALGLKS